MKKLLIIPVFFLLHYSNVKAQTWDSLGAGTNAPVQSFALFNGNIIAGGYFDTAGDIPVDYIAQWNGNSWDSIGTNDMEDISIVCTYDSELYAVDLSPRAPLLERWNDTIWSAVPGLYPTARPQYIWSLLVYNGKLYAGGSFSPLNHIGSWDNSNWDTLMNGTNGPVFSLTEFNGNLYTGGSFDSAGRILAKNIAAWNGTLWNNVGKGINGRVFALAVFNNNLYAGGSFDSAGGVPAKNIAVWNGSNWSPVGLGVSNSVYALTTYGSVLVAGGLFDTAGGIVCNKIAQWDGLNWSVLSNGIIGNNVSALYKDNGVLYVGGEFDSAGSIPANNIAQWRSPLGINTINEKNEEVSIFPNPSTGIFTVSLVGAQNLVPATIKIYNVLGEKVLTETLRSTQGNNLINLSSDVNGIYLYRILKENGELIGEGKVVVQSR